MPFSNNSKIWNVFYFEVHKKVCLQWLPKITSTSTQDQVLQLWIITKLGSRWYKCTLKNQKALYTITYIQWMIFSSRRVLTNQYFSVWSCSVLRTQVCDSMEIPSLDSSILNEAVQQEIEWLDATVPLNHDWTSYHASQKRYKKGRKDFTAVLPLLRKKVHTLSVQYHCMNIVTNTINKVNPRRTSVDVCGQPIFALTKQVQWRYPEKFGNYFCLFGGLYIEKSWLLLHGDFVSSNGLFKLLGISNLSVCSLQTVTTSVNDIKGARYTMQFSVCVIYKNLLFVH